MPQQTAPIPEEAIRRYRKYLRMAGPHSGSAPTEKKIARKKIAQAQGKHPGIHEAALLAEAGESTAKVKLGRAQADEEAGWWARAGAAIQNWAAGVVEEAINDEAIHTAAVEMGHELGDEFDEHVRAATRGTVDNAIDHIKESIMGAKTASFVEKLEEYVDVEVVDLEGKEGKGKKAKTFAVLGFDIEIPLALWEEIVDDKDKSADFIGWLHELAVGEEEDED